MFKKLAMSITKTAWKPRYFDIGVNFSDPMFKGYYNSRPKHPSDLDKVIERAHVFNVDKMLITASSVKESKEHLSLCHDYKGKFFSTAGVHPCTVAQEFYVKDDSGQYTEELRSDVDEVLQELKSIVVLGHKDGYIKAFGEIGLDYDRFHYSSKQQQLTMFEKQLQLIASLSHLQLPLFLHMRAACDDFVAVIKPFLDNGSILPGNGVVHSFTGTEEELQKLLDLGFYIGVNGCSLRNEENLPVAAKIPREKLLIETDAPWCEVRKSHASYKYLTPYPNKFYPLVSNEELDTAYKEEEQEDTTSAKPKPKQKSKATNTIKYDDFLPYPSIKKENFAKHLDAVELKRKQFQNPELIDDRIGDFAHPLVKSRNEPVFVGYIAEIMCSLYGIKDDAEIEQFIDTVYENTCKLLKV